MSTRIQSLGWLLVLCIGCSFSASAQHELMEEDALLFGWNRNHKHQIRIDYNYFVNSTGVTNGILNSAFRGDFLDADLKQGVTDKLKSSNRLGVEFDGRLQYKHIGEKLNFLVGVRSRDHLNTRFPDALSNLILWGNAPYAGEDLDLSPFKITYFHTQELSLSVEKADYGNGLVLGGGLSYLKGSRFAQAEISRGDFFTEENGAYIDLDLAMEYSFADATDTRLSSWYGNGVSLHGWMYKEMGDNMLVASLSDLGMISWSDLTGYTADTTYHFEGIEVDNILQLDDSLFNDTQTDSLPAALGLVAKPGSQTYFLPAAINVRYIMPLSDNTNLMVGVQQLLGANYRPRLSGVLAHRFSDAFALKGTLAYGGYSNLDVALGAAFDTGGSFRVTLDAYYLETLVSSTSAGQGVKAAVMLRF